MPLYDFVCLFKEAVQRKEVVEILKKVGSHVYGKKGVVTDVLSYGYIPLGYEIKRQGQRYSIAQMVQMTFMAPPSTPSELHYLNQDDRVLRHLTVKHKDWLKYDPSLDDRGVQEEYTPDPAAAAIDDAEEDESSAFVEADEEDWESWEEEMVMQGEEGEDINALFELQDRDIQEGREPRAYWWNAETSRWVDEEGVEQEVSGSEEGGGQGDESSAEGFQEGRSSERVTGMPVREAGKGAVKRGGAGEFSLAELLDSLGLEDRPSSLSPAGEKVGTEAGRVKQEPGQEQKVGKKPLQAERSKDARMGPKFTFQPSPGPKRKS